MACHMTRAVVIWAVLLGAIGLPRHTVEALTPERRYACWGSFGPPVVSAQCPRNTAIQVLRAGLKVQQHGGLCAYNHNDCGCEYGQPGCQMPDVRRLCMGRPACRLDVTQQYISTKRCKGFSDYMYIEFNCVPVEHNSVVSEICSAVSATSKSGFLRSPAGPASAQAGKRCECTFTTAHTSSIQLTVLDMQTRDYKCDHDKLLVAYDGRTDKYCGEEPDKKSIISQSAFVSVKYDTDRQGQGGSFWLKYEAEPKADVNLECTFTKRKLVPKPAASVTVEKTTPRVKPMKLRRLPTSRTHRPTAPTLAKTRHQPSRKDVTKAAKPKHKPPWWWKFVKSPNGTKPIRKATLKPASSVPFLVDAPKMAINSKPNRWSKVAFTATAATTAATVTIAIPSGRRHRYHHPKLVQANKGKYPISSTGVNAKLSLSPSVRSFVDKSGRRWSHLPKSLLNKLQFPVPMIRALEKELVVALQAKNRKEPILRILPDIQSAEAPSPQVKRSNFASSSSYSSRTYSSRSRYNPVRPVFSHKSTPPLKVMRSQHPVRLKPKSMHPEEKTIDIRLPKMNPPTPKTPFTSPPPQETVHSAHRFTASSVSKKSSDEASASAEQIANSKQLLIYPWSSTGQTIAKMKVASTTITSTSTTTSTTTTTTTINPTPTQTTQKLTTPKPPTKLPVTVKPSAGSVPSTSAKLPVPSSTLTLPAVGSKAVGSKRKSGSGEVVADGKVIRYKKPVSKEASVHAQPAWAEPLQLPADEMLGNPHLKGRSKAHSGRSKPPWGRRRFRLKTGGKRERPGKAGGAGRDRHKQPGGGTTRDRAANNKAKLKHKPKRVWRERADKTWVSVVKPEPKMYVPRWSQRKRFRKVSENISGEELNRPSTSALPMEPLRVVSKPPPTQGPASPVSPGGLMEDAVHNDEIMVARNLAGKIETVSDFYTALDEDDWMQWPAFERIKNAQQVVNNRTSVNASASATVLVTAAAATAAAPPVRRRKVPKPTYPPPRRHIVKMASHLPTTRRSYQRSAPTASHSEPTARRPLLPKTTKGTSVSNQSKTKIRRRKPGLPITSAFTPSKSESLTRPKDNTVTIIAVAAVGSVLIVVVLGIVIRFILNRKRDHYHSQPSSKPKRFKPPPTPDNHNFPGQMIPRPRRI